MIDNAVIAAVCLLVRPALVLFVFDGESIVFTFICVWLLLLLLLKLATNVVLLKLEVAFKAAVVAITAQGVLAVFLGCVLIKFA